MNNRFRVSAAVLVAVTSALPSSAVAGSAACAPPAGAVASVPGDPSCPGVRPGAAAFGAKDPRNEFCTFGFILKGSDGGRYVLLGHPCAPDFSIPTVKVGATDNESIWKAGRGPAILDSTGRTAGHLVYDVDKRTKEQDLDFALMRIAKGVRWDPRMCVYGGPGPINTDISFEPVLTRAYGQGNPSVGTVGPGPREDVAALGLNSPELIRVPMESETEQAGGPVVVAVDGLPALGIFSAWMAVDGKEPTTGYGAQVFRLAPILTRLRTKLKITFTLVRSGER